MWKDILARLYSQGKITIERLETAVVKGLITTEQKAQIIAE